MRSIRLLSTLTFIGHLFNSDSVFTQTADVYRLVSRVSAANTAEPIVGQFGLAHTLTLSVYRSRFEALPSIGPAIFAEQMVKRLNKGTENGHIYARGFAEDCYRLGCDL